MAHGHETGMGKPDHGYAPRAREVELDPFRELPYGPAACGSRNKRPNTCQRPSRRRTQRAIDHGGNLIVVDGARAARACLVKQAITAILQKSAARLANGVFVEAEFGSHRLAWQAIRPPQDRAASLRKATAQHDDDELASPSTPAPADSAPTARSAGLSHLHSPQALSSLEIRAINQCDELAFRMTRVCT
ncbi:hypothetical protein ACVIU7_004982 [Bradyrhizobium liaoningense]